jgi:hypothetical protein
MQGWRMVIGVDLDNTIVCYDALFARLAVEQNLCPLHIGANKTAVRDYLRASGREEQWTRLQGDVYGPAMQRAEPFPGVERFFQLCRARGVPVVIVSHRSRHPYAGPQHDLHRAARDWLEFRAFHEREGIGLNRDRVYLEGSKSDKLARIASLGCTHFIDDLPELLTDPEFPARVEKVLFDPNDAHERVPSTHRVTSWESAAHLLLSAE